MKAKTNKSIVCAKKPVQDIAAPCLIIAVTVPLAIYLTMMSHNMGFAIAFLPMWITAAFAAIYNQYRKVLFSKASIQNITLFTKRCYPYSQVKNVTEFLSHYGSRRIIWITFLDGKRIFLSQRYRNYDLCRKTILSHCSIRTR
ncbi:MAG: hypothetical protein ACI4V3_00875 [Faecousia sp.]